MKTFERVLFLAGFLFLDVFTTRHVYHLWLAPRSSVLDQFTTETEGAIASATSIDALVARYRPAHAAVRKLEEQNRGKPPDQWRFEEQEPFKTETTVRQAIEDWEQKHREIFEMRVYWAFGLLAVFIGLVIHTKFSEWLGIALLGTGFSEMIFWCSPTWFSRASVETDRLLVNKLSLSVAHVHSFHDRGALSWLATREGEVAGAAQLWLAADAVPFAGPALPRRAPVRIHVLWLRHVEAPRG